jgi:hypothetical protein
VTGGWKKLHNEELHNLHSSSSIIRINKSEGDEMEWHIAQIRVKGMHMGY